MGNQDKLYKQFQDASQKASEKEFPALDKIWGRVEEKLDKKALKKENNLWKKIAVAASVLLVITLGSQFLKLKNDKSIIKPKTDIVTNEKKENTVTKSEVDAIVSTQKPNPIIKENALEIMEAEVSKQQDYVVNDKISGAISADTISENLNKMKEIDDLQEVVVTSAYANKKQKMNAAVSVRRIEESELNAKSVNSQEAIQKQSPLYVVNGKAVTVGEKDKKSDTELVDLNSNDVDSIEILSEPLYIINGIEYSEEALFGPNPTSPYAPLNRQEILSTQILQGKEATSIYGEKGKKGVVIISTKNNKPAEKKK